MIERESPRLRPSVIVFSGETNILTFVSTTSGTRKTFRVDDRTTALVLDLDGSWTLADLRRKYDGEDDGFTTRTIAVLQQEGLLCRTPRSTTSSSDEHPRYDRQLKFFSEALEDRLFSEPYRSCDDVQRRLEQSHVLVIGLGALGSWTSMNLALMGVGHLRIVDNDVVELSNLSRQPLFRERDVSDPKVVAGGRALMALNGDLNVDIREEFIAGPEDVERLAESMDLVISCADYPSMADICNSISAACHPLGVPHLLGAGYGYRLSTVGTAIIPGVTPCWRCFDADARGDLMPAGSRQVRAVERPVGTVSAISAFIGSLLSWEATRLLVDRSSALAGRVGQFDPATLALTWRDIVADPDCDLCGAEMHTTASA
jgi:bacteriocin biosynthesis cyclodehydratase domain-containing protein